MILMRWMKALMLKIQTISSICVGYKFRSYNTRETGQISTIQRQYNWKTGRFSWFYIKYGAWFMKAFVNYNRWCYRNGRLKTWICFPFVKVCQKLEVSIASLSFIVIHEEALCTKSGGFAEVMKVVVKVQFILSLAEINSEYNSLTYFFKVCWLSRGKILERIFDLREKARNVFRRKGTSGLQNADSVLKLAVFIDKTPYLDDHNATLQGSNQLIDKL